jgi:hypothetical protein
MKDLKQVKLDLKTGIIKNIGKVFKVLGEDVLRTERNEVYNIYIQLRQEFQRIEKSRLEGILSPETINQNIASVTTRLMNFIDGLKEEDVHAYASFKESIYDKILVVTYSKERESYLEKFFPELYFRNIEYDSSKEKLVLDRDIDIIIYDSPKLAKDEIDDLLDYYLNLDDESVILYFGTFSRQLLGFPEKAYATNSVFSLHARINEIITYLKFRKVYRDSMTN